MKNTLFQLITIYLLLSSDVISQPNMVWEQRYNGPGNLQDNAYKIKCDNSGNIYITGGSIGSGTGYDFCTTKYSPTGSQIWIQRYNGPGNGDDGSVSLDMDNNNFVYVTGSSLNSSGNIDFCTIKYDSSGNLIWMKRYDGGFDDIPVALEADVSGNIYVTGSSENSSLNGCEKYVTLKYDSNGNLLWERTYDANIVESDIPADLTIDNNGNIIVTGTSNTPEDGDDIATVKYNCAGRQLWVNRFSLPSFTSTDWGNAVITDDNGNVYLTGYTANYDGEMVTIKYSSNGIQQWYALYDSNAVDQGFDINVYGNFVYVTGYTGGRLLVVKYDASGNLVWDRITREFHISIGNSAEIDNQGNIYATGYCSTMPSASVDFLTLKYDQNGNLQWYKTYNGLRDSNDVANDLCLDNYGNLYVTGWSRGFNTSSDFITLKYSNLTAIQPLTNEVPAEYSLSQNYPNPFNPTTKIQFTIPSSSSVAQTLLSVYDMLGREVSTLVNQQLSPGTYEVVWDTSNYSGGVYFYKLSSGVFSETKKMILIK